MGDRHEAPHRQTAGIGETIYSAGEVCSREAMCAAGRPPCILLTNVKQLELLLTWQQDIELVTAARLDYLIFDEAHTFTGAQRRKPPASSAACGRSAIPPKNAGVRLGKQMSARRVAPWRPA